MEGEPYPIVRIEDVLRPSPNKRKYQASVSVGLNNLLLYSDISIQILVSAGVTHPGAPNRPRCLPAQLTFTLALHRMP